MPTGPVGLDSERTLRSTVAALMHHTGENQTDLARGLRLTQGQVSRKQNGRASWSLPDLDRLSAHYGIPVPDLMCGPSRAVEMLPAVRRAATIGGSQSLFVVS
ncbi:helix-turn-helix domain-containing protein [Streptomyces sp. NPDC056486]|uniref:helix-turn-helix domain-containing protein n=1 Tax=Streptomyces sp. NPDC056486 TaxID=3345835 RepID=UPI0036CF6575